MKYENLITDINHLENDIQMTAAKSEDKSIGQRLTARVNSTGHAESGAAPRPTRRVPPWSRNSS